MTCQYDQMCVRNKAGIYGAVHGVQYIWDEKQTMEGWLFLIVDAKNELNEMWIVRHLWRTTLDSKLTFYRH